MPGERAFGFVLAASAAVVLALGPALVALLALGWAAAPAAQTAGVFAAMVGSLAVVLVAVAAAVPAGVGAGVYLAEYPGFGADMLRDLVHDVSGVPSVVHGVFGLAVFAGLMGLGHGPLAVGLTLSLVALPGIVRATEEAVIRIPGRRREAALALGATRWQVVMQVVLPSAGRGISAAVLAATARAAGEVAPLLVVGVALSSLLPSRLYAQAASPGREAFALALALALFTAGLSWAASVLRGSHQGAV